MKFKYFLRGLGTGIVFTSIVLLVAFMNSDSSTISDKEVIERAKELGMTEQEDSIEDLLSTENKSKEDSNKDIAEQETEKEDSDNNANEKDERTSEVISTEDTTTKEDTSEKTTSEIKTTEKQTTEKRTTQKQTTEKVTTEKETVVEDKTVTITIKGGMTSYPVCQKLQELGVITDATDFDNYLIKNGYANRISVGTHTLKIGMTYEEIAIAISDPR